MARLAERQHSVFTRAQAVAAGFTRHEIEHRLLTDRWAVIHRGVYRISGSAATWERSVMAAVLSAGPGAAASHRTAGTLWRLEGIEPAQVEIVVPQQRYLTISGVLVHRTRMIPRSDVTKIGVIPITTPARTLIDLASVVSREALEDALDDAIRKELVRVPSLRARLISLERRGRGGTGRLLDLVTVRMSRREAGSGRENSLRRLLIGAGLPEPIPQYTIRDAGGRFVARVDLAYPEARLALEYDGETSHSGGRRRRADLARQNGLVEVGWSFLRFTKADLRRGQSVISLVRRTLEGSEQSRTG